MPIEMTEIELQEKIDAAVAIATKGLKDNRDDTLGKLAKAKQDLADIEAAKEAELEAVEQERLKSEGKLEELIERLRTSHTNELNELKTKLKTAEDAGGKATDDLRKLIVDKGLSEGFLGVGVTNKDLLAAAVALNKDKAEIGTSEDGTPILLMGDQPIDEFLKEWGEAQGKAFITHTNSGGGAGGSKDNGSTDDMEAFFKPGTVNHTKQRELQLSDPERYKSLSAKYAPSNPLPLNAVRGR